MHYIINPIGCLYVCVYIIWNSSIEDHHPFSEPNRVLKSLHFYYILVNIVFYLFWYRSANFYLLFPLLIKERRKNFSMEGY